MIVDVDNAGLRAGHKVAFFVEHLIVGQTLLGVFSQDLAIADHPQHVVEGALAVARIADHQRDTGDFATEPLQRLTDAQFKTGPQQEIFRRVAAQRQLREHHQIRLQLITRLLRHLDHPLRVTGDIPHHQVQLGHGDPDSVTHLDF